MAPNERLEPDTAVKKNSIWKGIDRKAWDLQAASLEAKNHVAGRQYYPQPARPKNDDEYEIEVQLEKTLVDDFAFIAACQPNVDCVSSAAIELSESRPRIRVKLAANEGVSPNVQTAFDSLFHILRQHASKGDDINACSSPAFSTKRLRNIKRALRVSSV